MQVSQTIKIQPPKVEFIALEKYQLRNIRQDFEIADFERKQDVTHINRIVRSIQENKFYDNVFRVIRKGSKYIVLDGQHRIMAFVKLFNEMILQTYDFYLIVYDEQVARTAYRKINIGKRLQAFDHTKAMDDGNIAFFSELKGLAYHYQNNDAISYTSIIYAHAYYLSHEGGGSTDMLDKMIEKITPEDVTRLKTFAKAMKKHAGTISRNPLYRMSVFRNIYRVGREQKFDYDDYVDLISKLNKRKEVIPISMGRRQEHFDMIYKMITKDILKC